MRISPSASTRARPRVSSLAFARSHVLTAARNAAVVANAPKASSARAAPIGAPAPESAKNPAVRTAIDPTVLCVTIIGYHPRDQYRWAREHRMCNTRQWPSGERDDADARLSHCTDGGRLSPLAKSSRSQRDPKGSSCACHDRLPSAGLPMSNKIAFNPAAIPSPQREEEHGMELRLVPQRRGDVCEIRRGLRARHGGHTSTRPRPYVEPRLPRPSLASCQRCRVAPHPPIRLTN